MQRVARWLRVFLGLLVWGGGAVSGMAEPAAATQTTDELAAFGHDLASRCNLGRSDDVLRAWDLDEFVRRACYGFELTGALRRQFAAGAHRPVCQELERRMKHWTELRFSRVREVEGETRIVLRRSSATAGLSFLEFACVRGADGGWRAADVYDLRFGEWASEDVHRGLAGSVAKVKSSKWEAQAEQQLALLAGLKQVEKIERDLSLPDMRADKTAKLREALQSIADVPEIAQRHRRTLALQLALAFRAGQAPALASAIARWESVHPADPTLQLHLINIHAQRGDLAALDASLAALNARFGPDAELELWRARNALQRTRVDEATALTRRSREADPYYVAAYEFEIDLGLAAKDWTALVSALRSYEQKFGGQSLRELVETDTRFAGFRASEEGQRWQNVAEVRALPAQRPAKPMTATAELSEKEAQEFAANLMRHAGVADGSAIAEALDSEQFVRRALGRDAVLRFPEETRTQVGKLAVARFVWNVKREEARCCRVTTAGTEARVLLRTHGPAGFELLQLVCGRSDDGRIRAVDFCSFPCGEWESRLVRNELLAVIRDTVGEESLSEMERLWLQHSETINAVAYHLQEAQTPTAEQELAKLPAALLSSSRQLLWYGIVIAENLPNRSADAWYANWRRTFSDDLTLAVVRLGSVRPFQRPTPALLDDLAAIEAATGPDAEVEKLRITVGRLLSRAEVERAGYHRLVDLEPESPVAYSGAVEFEVRRRDYSAAVTLLRKASANGVPMLSIRRNLLAANWNQLRASEEFRAWQREVDAAATSAR